MPGGGTLVIRFIGDLKQFNKDLTGLSSRLSSAGSTMTRGLTLPIAAAGLAAVKTSMDFEKSMSLIHGVVGVSTEQVNKFSDVILKEGPKWGKSPQELADALYFVTSSGFSGAKALEVLEASAKASTAGLGEAETVADLLTSAINAYGGKNLDAAQSVDILAKAIDLGKLESEEFAGVMGRVLPVTSAMGVEFHEAAAAMSAMSMSGTDAAEGATQLRGILSTLMKPTVAAEKQLGAMGLSSEGLRKKLADDGLLSVLELLTQKFAGNTAATAKVFGNVRALTGVMNMMGANVDSTRHIFGEMENATGSMDRAFQAATETAQFKFDKGMAQVKASLIIVGADLLPLVGEGLSSLAHWLSVASDAWSNLDDGTRRVILAAVAFVAAAGPMLLIAGKVVAVMAMVSTPVGLVVAAIAALVAIFGAAGVKANGFMATLRSMAGPLIAVGAQIMGVLGPALSEIVALVQSQLLPAFARIMPIIGPVIGFLIRLIGSALVGVIKGAVSVIKGLVNVIAGTFNLISALIHGNWGEAWKAVKQIVKGAVQAVIGIIRVWLNLGILGLFRQGIKAIGKLWTGLWDWIKRTSAKAAGGLLKFMTSAITKLGSLFVRGLKAFGKTWASGLTTIVRFVAGLPGRAVGALRSLVPSLLAKGRDALGAMLTGAKAKGGAFLDWVKGLPGQIVSKLGDLASKMTSVGENAVRGIWAGFTNMGDWLYGQLMSWVKKVLPGPVEKALGIASPSKVMAELGRFAGQGLALGMMDTGADVAKASRALAALAVVSPTTVNGMPVDSPRRPGDDGPGPRPGNGGGGIHAPITVNMPATATPEAAADAAGARIVSSLNALGV